MQEGSKHCYALKAFLLELVGQHEFPISIYIDESVLSTNTLRDKCLNMDMAGLHEMLEKEEIKKIQGIPTQQQLVDCLTKKGASSKKLLQARKGQGSLA